MDDVSKIEVGPPKVVTMLGAEVSIYPATHSLTEGFMLSLGMADPKDLRRAEVFLSPANLAKLKEIVNKIDTPKRGRG